MPSLTLKKGKISSFPPKSASFGGKQMGSADPRQFSLGGTVEAQSPDSCCLPPLSVRLISPEAKLACPPHTLQGLDY